MCTGDRGDTSADPVSVAPSESTDRASACRSTQRCSLTRDCWRPRTAWRFGDRLSLIAQLVREHDSPARLHRAAPHACSRHRTPAASAPCRITGDRRNSCLCPRCATTNAPPGTPMAARPSTSIIAALGCGAKNCPGPYAESRPHQPPLGWRSQVSLDLRRCPSTGFQRRAIDLHQAPLDLPVSPDVRIVQRPIAQPKGAGCARLLSLRAAAADRGSRSGPTPS